MVGNQNILWHRRITWNSKFSIHKLRFLVAQPSLFTSIWSVVAGLSSCDRDGVSCKMEIMYCLALYRESVPVPGVAFDKWLFLLDPWRMVNKETQYRWAHRPFFFMVTMISSLFTAIQLNPGYIRAILRRAELYEKTDKLDEALEDYKSILEKDPSIHQAREACMVNLIFKKYFLFCSLCCYSLNLK